MICERAGLLVIGERVRVHRADAAVLEPVVLRAAGGHEVEAVEGLGIRCGQPLDDLRLELLELAARDDRHLDARRELEQELADAGVDGALRGGERVVEIEGDQAGGGHRVLPSGE